MIRQAHSTFIIIEPMGRHVCVWSSPKLLFCFAISVDFYVYWLSKESKRVKKQRTMISSWEFHNIICLWFEKIEKLWNASQIIQEIKICETLLIEHKNWDQIVCTKITILLFVQIKPDYVIAWSNNKHFFSALWIYQLWNLAVKI